MHIIRMCATKWRKLRWIDSVVYVAVSSTEVPISYTSIKTSQYFFSKTKTMKPLERSRQVLVWMGVQFVDDDPVSLRQKLARKLSTVAFAIVFVAISTLHVTTFLKLRLSNPEEFFFVLLQFAMMGHCCSGFITIYAYGSHISTVLQSLTQIYENCKPIKQCDSFAPNNCLSMDFFFKTLMIA